MAQIKGLTRASKARRSNDMRKYQFSRHASEVIVVKPRYREVTIKMSGATGRTNEVLALWSRINWIQK